MKKIILLSTVMAVTGLGKGLKASNEGQYATETPSLSRSTNLTNSHIVAREAEILSTQSGELLESVLASPRASLIRSLSISSYPCKDDDLIHLNRETVAKILALPSLTHLTMINEEAELEIKSDDEDEITSMLLKSPLQSLSILLGSFGDNNQIFAKLLKDNTTLRSLSIDLRFPEGDLSSAALADAIASNKTLKELKVFFGRYSEWDPRPFAEALGKNKTIKKLSLGHCIEDNAAIALAQTLKENSTLEELSLDAPWIGQPAVEALLEALRHNNSLKHLDLGGLYSFDMGQAWIDNIKKEFGDKISISFVQYYETQDSTFETR